MCRSSTTTIGSAIWSATAVGHLRPPEDEEAHDDREHGPADSVEPQAGVADDEVTVVEQRRAWLDTQAPVADGELAQMPVVGLVRSELVPQRLHERIPN